MSNKSPKNKEQKESDNQKEREEEAKSNQAMEEFKEPKEAEKGPFPSRGNSPKVRMNVNTKVKRIDPATVEISVRADPKQK